MQRCKKCCMPSTRPDHVFVEGVCPACINSEKKPDIDWAAREKELLNLLDKHDGRCIVPSSGGKDSTYQVIKLLELGADPLIVTATTCHLTEIGRKNIDNLARFATTIEVSPNKTVRAKLNRLGLEMVGDISWPEHAAIFSTPFRIAADLNISLIMYGENPQDQYGGPKGSEQAKQMTERWRSEYGGFLGLRPNDFIGMEGITKKDMEDYDLPSDGGVTSPLGVIISRNKPSEAHFLGQYIEWDSRQNVEIAEEHGMVYKMPCSANWWAAENQDNAQTGIHDHMMHRKYGYGRAATQLAVDVREGRITREFALHIIKERDGLFPYEYGGVLIGDILDNIGLSDKRFDEILNNFTNWELFDGEEDRRPLLKC